MTIHPAKLRPYDGEADTGEIGVCTARRLKLLLLEVVQPSPSAGIQESRIAQFLKLIKRSALFLLVFSQTSETLLLVSSHDCLKVC